MGGRLPPSHCRRSGTFALSVPDRAPLAAVRCTAPESSYSQLPLNFVLPPEVYTQLKRLIIGEGCNMASHSITLSELDYSRLTALVNANISAPAAESLEEELERASVLPLKKMPKNTVRMFSTVQYKNLDSGAITKVTIVYPGEADVAAAKVSVLAPIGAALIGLKVNQT